MVRSSFSAVAASTVLTLVACSGAAVPEGKNEQRHVAEDAAVGCSQHETSASNEIEQVISSHSSCSVDADCVTVERSANCFDHCSGVMNKSGRSALDAAKAKVDGAQCKQFQDQGCKLIRPPCEGPGAAVCKSGTCQDG